MLVRVWRCLGGEKMPRTQSLPYLTAVFGARGILCVNTVTSMMASSYSQMDLLSQYKGHCVV